MRNRQTENIVSVLSADEFISFTARCPNETEVQEATMGIVHYFGFQVFTFAVMVRSDAREHYRYLIGCDPQLCYRYLQNKWYAIDPLIDYALHNTSPVLASDVPSNSAGQLRMRLDAEEHGFRGCVVIPAHSSSSALIGVLYLGTNEGPESARQSLATHRNLMRALAIELLEWWNAKLRATNLDELELDDLDVELLCKARDHATADETAHELGITRSSVESRYRRLYTKLSVPARRNAVDKAVELGLIKPLP